MIKKLINIAVASVLVSVPGLALADGGAYLGYKQQDFQDSELQVLFVEYEHSFGKYFSISANVGTGLNDDVSQVKNDTYVEDLTSSEILTDSYEESSSLQYQYGVSLNGYLPLTDAFSAYGRVGYMKMKVENTTYPGFVMDNAPSTDPQAAFDDGASLCTATGIESICGSSFDKQVIAITDDIAIGEIGVKLEVTNKASFMFGYSKSLGGDDSYDGLSFRVGVFFW
jgi:hypothetical protein